MFPSVAMCGIRKSDISIKTIIAKSYHISNKQYTNKSQNNLNNDDRDHDQEFNERERRSRFFHEKFSCLYSSMTFLLLLLESRFILFNLQYII